MTNLAHHDTSKLSSAAGPAHVPAQRHQRSGTTVADFLSTVFGPNPPVAFACFDGSRLGPTNAKATVLVNSRDAIHRIITCPGDLGFGRAWVTGDLEVQGDLYAALDLRHAIADTHPTPAQIAAALRVLGPAGLKPLPLPAEEARLHGRRHAKGRDRSAISHHYDVSNAFYRLVLGPSMVYSCAVWHDATASLEQAQFDKMNLICQKLALKPGDRLLDVGCGWGSLLLHAAEHYGAGGVGVTVSQEQAELARQRVHNAGFGDRVEIRLQDYRDIADEPFNAISSVGMFEHVGEAKLQTYFDKLFSLLQPGGRLLNHGIATPQRPTGNWRRRSFIQAYVFPDGELLEIGTVVSAMQHAGFELRHTESLREHYALTLRRWVENLEQQWDAAVAQVGLRRARIWRLYMAGCGVAFEDGSNEIYQNLAVRPLPNGNSCMPLRPAW